MYMAKKDINEVQVINADNSNVEDKWLLSPVTFSQIGGNFSLLQQRVLAGILEKVQEKIIRAINDKEENKRFPSLFTEEEMNGNTMELEIDPSYFGVAPEHYDYLEDALKDLGNIRIAFPKAYKDKMNYVVAPLFSRLEIPMGKNRRRGKVRVVMLNENINDFMSMDKGYTLLMARITRISKKVRTPRIYQFLSSCQDIGHKKVLYEDFCKFLGIDDETARADRLNKINQQLKDKEITQKEANQRLEALAKWENPFRKFNKVRSQILDPAKMELDLFTSPDVDPNEEIDITFEYEPLYEGVSKRGNPSHLYFTIIKKRLALEHDREQAERRQRHTLINTLCERYRDLNVFDLRDIVSQVDAEDFADFRSFCYGDVAKAVERKQPDFVGAYVLTMLNGWISNHQKERTRTDYRLEETLFGELETEKPADTLEPGSGTDLWQRLLEEYTGPAAAALREVQYLGLDDGVFCVVATDEQRETISTKGDGELYRQARLILGMSETSFRPPIVMRKE